MEATTPRISTTFNLPLDVLNLLRQKAQRSHRALDAYIENVLMEDAYADEPNVTTHQAIIEAKTGERNPSEVYDSVDAMMKDLLEV